MYPIHLLHNHHPDHTSSQLCISPFTALCTTSACASGLITRSEQLQAGSHMLLTKKEATLLLYLTECCAAPTCSWLATTPPNKLVAAHIPMQGTYTTSSALACTTFRITLQSITSKKKCTSWLLHMHSDYLCNHQHRSLPTPATLPVPSTASAAM